MGTSPSDFLMMCSRIWMGQYTTIHSAWDCTLASQTLKLPHNPTQCTRCRPTSYVYITYSCYMMAICVSVQLLLPTGLICHFRNDIGTVMHIDQWLVEKKSINIFVIRKLKGITKSHSHSSVTARNELEESRNGYFTHRRMNLKACILCQCSWSRTLARCRPTCFRR